MITDEMVQAAARYITAETGWFIDGDVMRAALEAAERASWRDIETAPKDGTCILVASGGAVLAVSWAEEAYEHYTWITLDGYSIDTPTHWRPLPEPPTMPAGTADEQPNPSPSIRNPSP